MPLNQSDRCIGFALLCHGKTVRSTGEEQGAARSGTTRSTAEPSTTELKALTAVLNWRTNQLAVCGGD
jgi:hypothetical protein